MNSEHVVVLGAAEGVVDEAVIRRLVEHVGGAPGPIHGKNGKTALRGRINGFNVAAAHFPWIVLVDLNNDAECPPLFLPDWLPFPSPYMCFRVAVREIEAWLMADRERFARFLGVPIGRIPQAPEALTDPKRMVVDIAQHSRKRLIRSDIIPRVGSGRSIGPAYASRLIEFVETPIIGWRPEVAAENSPSLDRCLRRLKNLVGAWERILRGEQTS